MRVNEIFYSIQGEGRMTGTPAIFVRLSGCNLSCAFCDTDHHPFRMLSEAQICDEIAEWPARLVVVTGGEPALQLTESLVDRFHALGKFVAVETNGTMPLPANVDWITLSPKDVFESKGMVVLKRADELKLVFDGVHPVPNYAIPVTYHYLQPCDTGDEKQNKEILAKLVDYVKKHPEWRISLQTHKLMGVR